MSRQMQMAVLLDTGVLGALTHPKTYGTALAWARRVVNAGSVVIIPEIADYELRRELIRRKDIQGVRRLDDLKTAFGYAHITTDVMLLAANLWAQARIGGYPTAHEKALDGDVILAAQARQVEKAGFTVLVATTNIGHLSHFVNAQDWQTM